MARMRIVARTPLLAPTPVCVSHRVLLLLFVVAPYILPFGAASGSSFAVKAKRCRYIRRTTPMKHYQCSVPCLLCHRHTRYRTLSSTFSALRTMHHYTDGNVLLAALANAMFITTDLLPCEHQVYQCMISEWAF